MSEPHVPELTLRRVFSGELSGADAEVVRKHAHDCTACRAKLRSIEEEQAKFEAAVPLERFKAGVERSARGTFGGGRSPVGYLVVAAAAMVFLVAVPAILVNLKSGTGANRTKGVGIDLYIAPVNDGPQRTTSATTPELLAPGDRLRIAYKANGYHYITAVSVDEQGALTALTPESGLSPKVCDPFAKCVLPDAWEMTGEGAETIVVLLSDGPLDMNDVLIATQDAYERAGGKVTELPDIYIPGLQLAQSRRTVLKP